MLPVLFERHKRSHMKRSWRDCDCSYCEEKRQNHAYLQFAPYFLDHERKKEWREGRIKHTRTVLQAESEKVV
jgi:hypothetical protein